MCLLCKPSQLLLRASELNITKQADMLHVEHCFMAQGTGSHLLVPACLIADLIERHRGTSLPLGPPSSCITAVVKESQQLWPAHAQDYTNSMATLLQTVCHNLCSTHFKEYPKLADRIK